MPCTLARVARPIAALWMISLHSSTVSSSLSMIALSWSTPEAGTAAQEAGAAAAPGRGAGVGADASMGAGVESGVDRVSVRNQAGSLPGFPIPRSGADAGGTDADADADADADGSTPPELAAEAAGAEADGPEEDSELEEPGADGGGDA